MLLTDASASNAAQVFVIIPNNASQVHAIDRLIKFSIPKENIYFVHSKGLFSIEFWSVRADPDEHVVLKFRLDPYDVGILTEVFHCKVKIVVKGVC